MTIWRCDHCEYDNESSDSHCVRCEFSRQIMEGGQLVDRKPMKMHVDYEWSLRQLQKPDAGDEP